MANIKTIDLKFLNETAAIAAFAVGDDEGYTLVECGPFSTHETLINGLAAENIKPDEVHSVLLTHIHFDHAGAAWWWAERGAKIYVHPRGLKHMIDPTRLYGSAARIYGEENMAKLWGRMETIAPDMISAVEDREELRIGGQTWTAHHTPGHASHHIAWQLEDVVFTGDVGGVMIKGGPVVPPLPPPDIDLDEWRSSLERLAELEATTFYLTHYGPVPAGHGHLDRLGRRLEAYVGWVEAEAATGKSIPEMVPGFTDFVETDLRENGVSEEVIGAYRAANPPYMSVAGIVRWVTK